VSAVVVSYTKLRCDGCKSVRDHVAVDVTAARIEAAKSGWRYATKKERARLVFDACPDCKIPGDYLETPRV
jgi:hypothetical protein